MSDTKKLMILICSRHPNSFLYENIEKLREFYKDAKIAVIDSDSEKFDTYDKIKESFPEVDIQLLKNKNYEYGAWKLGYALYPDYDIYMCIQDALIIQKYIDLSIIDSKHAYTFFNPTGFYLDYHSRDIAIRLMENTGINYQNLLYVDFNLATHASFIVSNSRLKHMYSILVNPITCKLEGRAYERIFGIYFITHDVKTFDIDDSFTKITGYRK